jgi:hypothetical protein
VLTNDGGFALARSGGYRAGLPPEERTAYDAPEFDPGRPTESTDIYSFAFILYFVLCGKVPTGKSLRHLANKLRPDMPRSVPKSLQRIVVHCWGENPASRFSAEAAVLALGGIEIEAADFDREQFLAFVRSTDAAAGTRSHFSLIERETIHVRHRIESVIQKVERQREGLEALRPKTQKQIHDEVAAVRGKITVAQKKMKEADEVMQGLRQAAAVCEGRAGGLKVDRSAIQRLTTQLQATEDEIAELEQDAQEEAPAVDFRALARRSSSK